jgi:hypothetical protein
MRNPWGSELYSGPWNDKDKRWTPALLKQVNHYPANDGVFWMPVEDFRTPFSVLSVARYDENWHTAHVVNKGGNPTRSNLFKLYIDNPVEQEVNI